MFLDRNSYISKSGKLVKRAVLRHSYRQNGVVKKKNIANLSSLCDEQLDAIEIALKSKKNKCKTSVEHKRKWSLKIIF
mgnify:CR=1 FL=1